MNVDFYLLFQNYKLENLRSLKLDNLSLRNKKLDENEIKAILNCFNKLESLSLNCYCLDIQTLQILFKKFHNISYLELTECQNLDNQLIYMIVKYLYCLDTLILKASFNNYNQKIDFGGFIYMKQARFRLNKVEIHYFSMIGNKTLSLLCEKFYSTLEEIHMIRNCFEKCSEINENCYKELKLCQNIKKFSLVFARNLKMGIGHLLIQYFQNIVYLNIKDCPIQEDLQILIDKCPRLKEVDMSGDSWVHESALKGLAKHENLKVFKMGHFQHSDQSCENILQENPPKGLFIEALFKAKNSQGQFLNFKNLTSLYLEKNCSLTYWLDIRIQNIRKSLTIMYLTEQNIFQNKDD